MKMASGDEDDDLEALRFAVLASMKPRVEDKDETSRDRDSDTEEDPELAALREAALKTKGQNSSSNRIVQSPKPNSAPIVPHHFPRGRGRGRARGRGRGVHGAGRVGMAPNIFRGGKAGSNLIVINTVPEEEPVSGVGKRKQAPDSVRESSSSNVFLRPQDKWASSISDSNSGTSSPSRSKVPNKFSRIDSSGSDDSESESDFDELVAGEDAESNSEEEEDLLNLDNSGNEGNESEDNRLGGEEETGYENSQSAESESKDQTEQEAENSSDVNFQKSEGSDSDKPRTSNVASAMDADDDSNANAEPVKEPVIEPSRIVEFSDSDQNVKQDRTSEYSRTVVSPLTAQIDSPSTETQGKPVSTGLSNVKSRLGLKPNIPKGNEISEHSASSIREPMSDTMSPEEKQIFAARQKKFMEIMEVKDLKKTVSLKGIVPPKKPKQDVRKELPKQYRHKRNRSRSNSRSPSGKVSSNHRKRERRKHKEGETGSRVRGQRQVSRDKSSVKVERKVRKSLSSDSDTDFDKRSVPLSDSESSDSEALPWRFKHTGKSAWSERVSGGGQVTSVFERPPADVERERKQRQRLERADNPRLDNSRLEGRYNRRNHTPERCPVRHSPSRHRRKRFVEEVSPERDTRRSSVKTVVTSIVKLNSEPARSVKESGIVTSSSRSAPVKSKSHSPSSSSDSSSSSLSSEEESRKKRDARSIIVSLRTKDGGEKEETKKDRGDVGTVKEDTEKRSSPVVNITFSSESPTVKPRVSSRDRGSIHQRLGIPVRAKDPVDDVGLDPSQRKPRRHVMEEDGLDDKPLKFGIRKTDSSVRSRPVLGSAVEPASVHTSKAKRVVRKDCDEAREEEAVVKTNHLISVSPGDHEVRRRASHEGKRKSEDRSDAGIGKKIKLNTSSEDADQRAAGDKYNTKGKTPEEIQLDERIRKIHEKNQAILKRQREVIQDKKLYG